MRKFLCGVVIVVSFAGCMAIKQPPTNSSVAPPVVSEITWGSEMKPGTLKIALDGVSILEQFDVNVQQRVAKSNTLFSPAVGKHKLEVSAIVWYAIYFRFAGAGAMSEFTVTPPAGNFSVDVSSGTLVLERGRQAATGITITRTGAFTGAVTVAISPLPNGVTANTPLAVAGSTGTLTLTANASAEFGARSATLSVSPSAGSGATTKTVPITVVVARRSGDFKESIPPTAGYIQSPRTGTSPDGKFSVASVSVAGSTFEHNAFFKKLADNTSFAPVKYYLGQDDLGRCPSNEGGAAFNPDPTSTSWGVVLSGRANRFSQTTTHVYFLIDLKNPSRWVTIGVDPCKGQNHVVPQVFFSPDSTVAMSAAADPNGLYQRLLLFFDLVTGRSFYSRGFNTLTANAFKASVVLSNNSSAVRVEADGLTTTQLIP